MSDQIGIEPPREPAPAPQLVFPLTVPEPPRSRAPMIAGIIAVFVVVAIALTGGIYVLSGTVARAVDISDLGAAEQVVRDLDSAFENADCDAFEEVTTEDARDDILGDSYDCETFEVAAAALTDGGDYVYGVTITDSRKRGELVTVSTEEAYGDADPIDYTYVLERDGGRWRITAYGEE